MPNSHPQNGGSRMQLKPRALDHRAKAEHQPRLEVLKPFSNYSTNKSNLTFCNMCFSSEPHPMSSRKFSSSRSRTASCGAVTVYRFVGVFDWKIAMLIRMPDRLVLMCLLLVRIWFCTRLNHARMKTCPDIHLGLNRSGALARRKSLARSTVEMSNCFSWFVQFLWDSRDFPAHAVYA